jgi:hypothetical protein
MVDILLIVSFGNGGIEEAKKKALIRFPEADDIINIEVDTRHRSIMSVYNSSTTILRGKAIKYINKK